LLEALLDGAIVIEQAALIDRFLARQAVFERLAGLRWKRRIAGKKKIR
jgi:hypothetical protein